MLTLCLSPVNNVTNVAGCFASQRPHRDLRSFLWYVKCCKTWLSTANTDICNFEVMLTTASTSFKKFWWCWLYGYRSNPRRLNWATRRTVPPKRQRWTADFFFIVFQGFPSDFHLKPSTGKTRKGHQSLNQAFKRDVREVLYHNESYLSP